ncbi:MAG: DUF5107 domain-containing protein [Anaerolineae bacterium]|jgi:hypothetical protein|nr:DUF5107 domain-containing protein [Anaerolineae bacterium]
MQPVGTISFYTIPIVIPTYPYAQHLNTETNALYNISYPVLDWGEYQDSHPTASPVTYTLLVLENDYLKVTLLPEVGGRVYQLIYKATGSNELYQNPVLKPTAWGPVEQGWWVAAGGIEWALPVDEHGYEWGVPWDWDLITSTAGVTVTVRDSVASDRLRAAIDLFLPADRGYLAVRPHIENPTAAEVGYKFWLNAMLAPGVDNRPSADLEFVFNAAEVAIHSTGDDRLPGAHETLTGPDHRISWPVYKGVNYSRLGNWDEWLGFFEYPQAADTFIGVYNHAAEEGVARVFPPDVARGAKGFGMGWQHVLNSNLWTDDGSGYVELHGGIAPTFWDQATLPGGETLSWSEYWYPIGDIGTLSAATAEGALGVRVENELLHVGVHPTQAWGEAESRLYVWRRQDCELLSQDVLPGVGPAHPYTVITSLAGLSVDQVSVAYVDSAGSSLVELNPTGCELPPLLPRLSVEPQSRFLMIALADRGILTTSFEVQNSGYGVLSWTAQVDPSTSLVPVLLMDHGVQGDWMTMTADTTLLGVGSYTSRISVTAITSDVLDSPQQVRLDVRIVLQINRIFLPLILRDYEVGTGMPYTSDLNAVSERAGSTRPQHLQHRQRSSGNLPNHC